MPSQGSAYLCWTKQKTFIGAAHHLFGIEWMPNFETHVQLKKGRVALKSWLIYISPHRPCQQSMWSLSQPSRSFKNGPLAPTVHHLLTKVSQSLAMHSNTMQNMFSCKLVSSGLSEQPGGGCRSAYCFSRFSSLTEFLPLNRVFQSFSSTRS